jgi:bifunctional UDP-N-acetylglucosamine pyrophosphorylase/glucosamine-1-phosphate N-acetyltransferase
VGSDSVLIAPVEIGPGAYVAAGSAIASDVPPGALGVTRAPQRSVDGWVARKRPGTVSDAAARAASAAAPAGATDEGEQLHAEQDRGDASPATGDTASE